MKAKLSLIVPHWPLLPIHDDLLKICLQSIPADEKIVVVNDGTGMGKAINQGLRLITNGFVLVSNNDCKLIEGDVRDLCDQNAICIPKDVEGQWDKPRCFYCAPIWVFEEVGNYDERFKVGYWEDTDLIRRWEQSDIPIKIVDTVKVAHNPGTTMDKHPERDRIYEENKQKFIEKWGSL